MIDIDKLQRTVDTVDGPVVAVSKTWLAEIIGELRSGRTARLQLLRTTAFGAVCTAIATGSVS